MLREIALDTETTGLDPASGHRVVEIGCVEMVGHVRTGSHFHTYINPERDMPREAENTHGLSAEFLKDKPVFRTIARAFLEFIGDSPLVIHNAGFDLKFLNAELNALDLPLIAVERATDTVIIARKMFPGSPANLDALCKRFAIDTSARTKHGALLDAELLADVYLAMTRGQESLIMSVDEPPPQMDDGSGAGFAERPPLRVLRALPDELEGHERVLGEIAKANKGHCMWNPPAPPAAG